jgi:hypothetical protein
MTLATLLFAAILPAQTVHDIYAWPLDLPRELTSSFAEFRPGRYHMGIDLRTGPTGKNVYAAADGYVARIRCSPYGYGKAVYLQLNDGNSAVYAHLSDFAPPLRDYVRRAQHQRMEYTVDLTPKPGEFPIKRGELIAKSGQTGIGVPHLHYEIRDPKGIPINPRLAGVHWPDTKAPIIRSVAIVPLDPHSMAGNDFRGTVLTQKHDDEGRLVITSPTPVEGLLAFAVDVFDPGPGGSRLGVYRVTASCAGKEIFTVRNDRISYDHAEDGAIAFARLSDRDQLLRLWRTPGNDAEAYTATAEDGAFELQSPTAEVLITAEDFEGNKATLNLPLRRAEAEPAPPESEMYRDEPKATLQFTGQTLVAHMTFPGDEVTAPVLLVAGDRPERITLRRIDARNFQTAWLPQTPFFDGKLRLDHEHYAEPPHRWVFVRRGEAARRVDVDDLRIETQPESPYGTLAFEAKLVGGVKDVELTELGPVYDLRPNDLPLDAPITISLPLPPSVGHPDRAFFYRRDDAKKKWTLLETARKQGRASAAIRQLGVYALLTDGTPPTLAIRTPARDKPIENRRPRIEALARDLGSGVKEFRATFNGQWLLIGYDPEQDLLTWEQDEDLPPGLGTLVVEARDYAGNLSRRELSLTIPPTAK